MLQVLLLFIIYIITTQMAQLSLRTSRLLWSLDFCGILHFTYSPYIHGFSMASSHLQKNMVFGALAMLNFP